MPPLPSHGPDETGSRSTTSHEPRNRIVEPGPIPSPRRFRGSLPHFNAAGILQHITYRLADSLPARLIQELERELVHLPPGRLKTEKRRRVEACLDSGYGSCILRHPEAAGVVVETWKRFDPERYRLIAYVVMPNHGHVLIETSGACPLPKVVNSWKSYTGRRILSCDRICGPMTGGRAGARLGREGSGKPHGFWQMDYWDRFIRDEKHFHEVVEYIENNPVSAGLVRDKEDWPWSSAGKKIE
jgi:putative transposase